jgi:hypothetical protein
MGGAGSGKSIAIVQELVERMLTEDDIRVLVVRKTGPSLTTTTWQMWLGKSQWNDPYLNGAIDELRVFNRALNSGEVAYLAGDR